MLLAILPMLAACETASPMPAPMSTPDTDPAARMVEACEASLGSRAQPAFDACLIRQLQQWTADKEREASEREAAARERQDNSDFWRGVLASGLIGAGGAARTQQPTSPYAPTTPQYCRIQPSGQIFCW